MFGYSHLPFSTSFTESFNGVQESFVLYIDQSSDFNLFIEQELNLDMFLEQFPYITLL
jgi:hypothetical protein